MREIMRHRPGKIFLIVLLISLLIMLYIPKFFFQQYLFFGFITLPFLSGVLFLLVWLVAYLIYFFRYWPFRN